MLPKRSGSSAGVVADSLAATFSCFVGSSSICLALWLRLIYCLYCVFYSGCADAKVCLRFEGPASIWKRLTGHRAAWPHSTTPSTQHSHMQRHMDAKSLESTLLVASFIVCANCLWQVAAMMLGWNCKRPAGLAWCCSHVQNTHLKETRLWDFQERHAITSNIHVLATSSGDERATVGFLDDIKDSFMMPLTPWFTWHSVRK